MKEFRESNFANKCGRCFRQYFKVSIVGCALKEKRVQEKISINKILKTLYTGQR
jgi:hypothetical protein